MGTDADVEVNITSFGRYKKTIFSVVLVICVLWTIGTVYTINHPNPYAFFTVSSRNDSGNGTNTPAHPPIKYLTMKKYHGRLGNRMFQYAGLKGLARDVGRIPVVSGVAFVQTAFKIHLSSPKVDLSQSVYHKVGSIRGLSVKDGLARLNHTVIDICCYLNGAVYFDSIKDEIRREFTFRDHIVKSARDFLDKHVPSKWTNGSYIRVGIQVRRTDRMQGQWQRREPFPQKSYFQNAVKYFQDMNPRVQFVVASDDLNWCKHFFNEFNADFLYLQGLGQYGDMCALTMCDHTVVTIGTYSWWVGWLGRGTTIHPYTMTPPHNDSYNNWIKMS